MALAVTIKQTQSSSLSCTCGEWWRKFVVSFASCYRKDPGGLLKV